MNNSRRYQYGTIEEIDTAAGPCWYIRFHTPDGDIKRPRFRIGLKSDIPTKAKASRAAQHLRDRFNSPDESLLRVTRTFGDVIARYEREEMPSKYSTSRGYRKIHKVHILPKWGTTPLAEMDAMEVRAWLKGLDKASRTKGHIHGQMRVLFRFAMLWKWLPLAVNPMSLFTIPGASKRTRKPRVINPAQFRELLKYFRNDTKMQALLIGAYCLGLRVNELFALQWRDFDFLGERVSIMRGVVDGRVGEVKTERSEAPLPLAPNVSAAFLRWYQDATFKESDDKEPDDNWVFASDFHAGELPMNSKWVQQTYLRKAGEALKLDFNLGWHTLRHSYKVLLERAGADLTVQRDLMRHADTHTTSQIYGEVEFDRMRTANYKAVALAFEEGGES